MNKLLNILAAGSNVQSPLESSHLITLAFNLRKFSFDFSYQIFKRIDDLNGDHLRHSPTSVGCTKFVKSNERPSCMCEIVQEMQPN